MPAFTRRTSFPTALAFAAVCLISPASAQRPLASASGPRQEKVTVGLHRNVYSLNGRQVREAQIGPLLAACIRKNPRITAVIRCDKDQSFGSIETLMDLVKQAGVRSVMVASPTAIPAPRRFHTRH